jgi:hypothetical protein
MPVNNTHKSSTTPLLGVIGIGVLLTVVAVQWALISYLLQERHSYTVGTGGTNAVDRQRAALTGQLSSPAVERVSRSTAKKALNKAEVEHFQGVAATILFSAPAWFHRRYPIMIQNVLSNTPNKNWALQLFIHPKFWQENVVPLHSGLLDLIERHQDRIVITYLPPEMQQLKQPNQRILLTDWFWKTLVADQVLLFSGNGILCTNGCTADRWGELLALDYVGVPWGKYDKLGGDGSTHSFRNRNLMLRALEYARQSNLRQELPESSFFVKTLPENETTRQYSIHNDSDTRTDPMVWRCSNHQLDHQRTSSTYTTTSHGRQWNAR